MKNVVWTEERDINLTKSEQYHQYVKIKSICYSWRLVSVNLFNKNTK